MPIYTSTYISGFGSFIDSLQTTKPYYHEDGFIVYNSEKNYEEIASLKHFNNSFEVLTTKQTSPNSTTDKAVFDLKKNISLHKLQKIIAKMPIKTIKVIISKENEIQSISKSLRDDIRTLLSQTGVKIDPVDPDTELWFLIRRSGFSCAGIRITNVGKKRYRPQKGELRPELAHILCLLSRPTKEDIIFDPFAGSGSILKERAQLPFKKIYASDKDTLIVKNLEKQFEKEKNIIIKKTNALKLNFLNEDSITTIITDPPWGFFSEKETDFLDFYRKMLEEFRRILQERGCVIVLTAKKEEFESAIKKYRYFDIKHNYNILVSGKKAGVYILN